MIEKRLTKEIAEQFLKDEDSMDLREFAVIDDDAAESLSRHEGEELALDGLTTFSDAAAEALGMHTGVDLSLNGLTSLSDKAAESLGMHEGERLSLDGLTSLSDVAFESLSKCEGSLSLNGLVLQIVRSVLDEPIVEQDDEGWGLRLFAGDPEEVIVTITAGAVEVAIFDLRWDGPHTPVVHPKLLGVLYWGHFSPSQFEEMLTALVQTACQFRQAEFTKCRYCDRVLGPEHMHGDVCHGCAERHEGVVH